jgi:Leucine-rich repeat (LRR) protein
LKSLQVTDDDLLNTPGLAKELSGLAVSDETFAGFKNCSKLDQLFLDSTKLTDKSLPLIASFSNLEELDLSNTQVTDEAIHALGKLRKLKTLHLTGSGVTPGGVQKLKALLPKVEIQQ